MKRPCSPVRMAADLVVMNGLGKNAQDVRLLKGVDMRIPPDRRSNKASKKSGALVPAEDAQRANDWAAKWAELEKSPLHHGNTAGGRTPPYKPEYAIKAKELCARGATTNELARFFDVSPETIEMWKVTHDDFLKACELMAACMERVKRRLYDNSIEMKIITEKVVESGSQRQTAKTTTTSPGNVAAARSFVIDRVVPVEDQIAEMLRDLQGTWAGIKYRGPDGGMMTVAEHVHLGGVAGGSEIYWAIQTTEEIEQAKQSLLELRRKQHLPELRQKP